MSKKCPRKALSRSDPAYWLERLYRNTYTHGGKQFAVRGWAVKIQHAGVRKTISLEQSDPSQAAAEACRVYNTILAEGWGTMELRQSQSSKGDEIGHGQASQSRLDSEYWRQRLMKRRYPEVASQEEREFAVNIEHSGVSHYFSLGTNVESEAGELAAEIYQVIRSRGWGVAGQKYSRELALAIRWLDNPLAWTYTTFHTWRTPVVLSARAAETPERKVILVEPDPGIRRSFAANLSTQPGFCCCAAYASLGQMWKELARRPVDLVLVNGSIREEAGRSCIEQLQGRKRPVVGVLYSVFEDADQLFKSTPGGGIGYMLKRTPLNQLLDPIAGAGGPLTHEGVLSKVREYFQKLVLAMPSGTSLSEVVRLTAREREILSRLAKGYVTKEIAVSLGISSWTVNGHVKSIFEKLNVHTRTEAVVKFLRD